MMTTLSRLLGRALCSGRLLRCNPVFQLPRRHFRRPHLEKKTEIQLTPQVEIETPNIHNAGRSLFKCALFTIGFTSTTFAAVSIWRYERIRREKKDPFQYWANIRWNSMEGWQNKEGDWRQQLNKWWNELSEGHKMYWPIFFINAVVYASWHMPVLRQFMYRYFTFSPAARAVCLPMVLATFSHYSLLHFAANMYVLHSFSDPVCSKLGREQFLGLYLSCGVISSLTGAMFKVLIKSVSPSLGASGAIMGILSYFCCKYPDSQLGIIFIPQFHFSAEQGLLGILCLDTAGLIFRWRLFDHAAHLGGALSGVAYARWGGDIWQHNTVVVRLWHQFREPGTR